MSKESISNKRTDEKLDGVFVFSESNCNQFKGEFKIFKKHDFKIFTLDNFIKFMFVLAVLSGMYGFFFQKGMLSKVGMEFSLVNLDLREIYYFSYIGTSFVFGKLLNISADIVWFHAFLCSLLFWVLGLIFCFFIRRKFFVDNVNKNKKIFKIFSFFRLFRSYFFSSLSCSLLGFLGYFLQLAYLFLLKNMLLIFIALILLPGLVGYSNGMDYMDEMMKKSFCNEPKYQGHYFVGDGICPILVIKGSYIWGDVVLETPDLYYIRREKYFLKVNKKGGECVFSSYLKGKGKEISLDPDIQSLCFKKPDVAKATNS